MNVDTTREITQNGLTKGILNVFVCIIIANGMFINACVRHCHHLSVGIEQRD